MNKSMTGYGVASFEKEGKTITVEVRTLNSKYLDINLRLPRAFSEKELEIRNLISSQLERGKVSLSIDYQNRTNVSSRRGLNKDLFKDYFQELKAISNEVDAGKEDIFKLALEAPEVMTVETIKEDFGEDWEIILATFTKAIELCNQFRKQEGDALGKKLLSYAEAIDKLLDKVEKRDPKRIEGLKSRIQQQLTELVSPENVDKNRFEQELIYYIEKLDINEEKVRLRNHLDFFREIIHSDKSEGKKLGFVSQEIGREINTIGSKANDSEIQKLVVGMKEELEKIKEQCLNIL
ncbi:YicC family protein [Cytophagales bacterium RKSG123]|nr:YicC family protein [Xanthovirga aplysinae]